ncbi:hypothetical protein FANTH_14805 [Fusarium anthophilum]|uniref:Uncharacterized protein n=1 Tax=Fusarium anthophilum TaxID=48485 RepID=A0A8H4YG56_9HYPO|nr:hypothetical protein FANTH_14805 [Fusarium anthophilum]
MRVFPFNPLLVNMDQFELDMHGYLRSYTAGEFKDMPISNEWGKERAIGLISLILAVLSSAAHYSDLAGPDRSRVCYDLGVATGKLLVPSNPGSYSDNIDLSSPSSNSALLRQRGKDGPSGHSQGQSKDLLAPLTFQYPQVEYHIAGYTTQWIQIAKTQNLLITLSCVPFIEFQRQR